MNTTRNDMLAKAHELAPVLAERAQKTEKNRAPLDETVDDLIESGLLSLLTPKAYGGAELGIDVASDVVRILSAADASTGWNAAFYIGAPWRANIFSEQAQRELLADKPYALMCGTAAPLGTVEKVDGGYQISGQTAWNSGASHAEWFTFNGIVVTEGRPEPTWFLVPRSEVEVLDTWFIKGMSGTASTDVRVKDVFVPDYRTGSFALALAGKGPGQHVHANPMYHLPFLTFAMAEVTPVVVGAFRGLTDGLLKRTRTRQSTIGHEKTVERQSAQMRLGRALATANAAEALLQTMLEGMSAEKTAPVDRAGTKLQAAYITDICRNAANDIVRGIGADGFRDASVLQRHFRDLNVLAIHAFLDIDNATETISRFTLDLPITDRLI